MDNGNSNIAEIIQAGEGVIGIELGSTRIKAVLIGARTTCRSPPAVTDGKTHWPTASGPIRLKKSGRAFRTVWPSWQANVEKEYGAR